MRRLNRREFIRAGGVGFAAVAAGFAARSASVSKPVRKVGPCEKVGLALVGCGKRGTADILALSATGRAEVLAVCDPDRSRAERTAALVERRSRRRPLVARDFRLLLERADVEAVVVAPPDHWHALATILACEAGKDVFVETPLCRTVAEGEAMVRAARENRRIVAAPDPLLEAEHLRSAAEYVRSGKLGRVGLCRAWVCRQGGKLRGGPGGAAPVGVDYDLWLGPAPKRLFHPDRFHATWRVFEDYSAAGVLGDPGASLLGVVRAAMGAGRPETVVSTGGVVNFADGREMPDTQNVRFDFPGFSLVWEHREWPAEGSDGPPTLGVAFYGADAALVADRDGWRAYAEPGLEVIEESKNPPAAAVRTNAEVFLDCVLSRKKPQNDIEAAFETTAWCLAGMAAYRLGRELRFGTWDGGKIADLSALPACRKPWAIPRRYLRA